MITLKHALLWGVLGLFLEIVFTGFKSLLKGNLKAESTTFLWMLPIYGLGGLTLEHAHRYCHYGFLGNLFLYTVIIYAFEYGFGWLLKKTIGVCPWDYSYTRYSVHGFIRLDYLPYWMAVAAFWMVTNQFWLKLWAI